MKMLLPAFLTVVASASVSYGYLKLAENYYPNNASVSPAQESIDSGKTIESNIPSEPNNFGKTSESNAPPDPNDFGKTSESNAFQDIPFDSKGLALPFSNTARGVQDYANKQYWGNKKKVVFTDIGDNSGLVTPCFVIQYQSFSGQMSQLECGGGYVTIVDPLGTKVCELDSFFGLTYLPISRRFSIKTKRCTQR